MRKITVSLFVLLLFVNNIFSQIDDILKKIPGVGDVFESAVSTTIKDAYPSALWLNQLDKQMSFRTDTRFSADLSGGYYKFRFNTFCLHAGTYAPTEGSGYLVAPLKGAKSGLIKDILSRYSEHPEIDQKDVQMLIWGIEAGQKFSNYDLSFQARVTPLLKPEDIALMEVNVKDIAYDLLPQEAKDVVDRYRDMRNKMSDVNSTYEDVERLAVKTGIPPLGKGSKNISLGTWTSIGDGVYMRCFPEGYQHSNVEIYIPEAVNIQKDEKGNIVSMDNGSFRVDLSYETGSVKFKTVTLKNYSTSEEITFDNTLTDDASVKKNADDFAKLVKKSFGKKRSKRVNTEDLKMLIQLKSIEQNIGSLVDKSNWQHDGYSLIVNAVNNYVAEIESGTKKGGSLSRKTGLSNMSGLVFAPGNTSSQRLWNGGPEGGTNGDPNSGNNNEGNNGNNNTGNNGNNGNNNQTNNEEQEKKKKEEEEKKKKEEEEKKKKCNNTIEGVTSIGQPTQRTCWAATTTTLMDYRDNKAYEVDAVVKKLGPDYQEMYKKDQVLPKDKLDDFLKKTGFVAEPNSFPLSNIPDLIKEYGPVIVLSDVSGPGEDFLLHARIIYGVEGDCTFNNSSFKLKDPDPEKDASYKLTYNELTNQIAKYVNKSSEGIYPYLIHLPKK